MMKRAEISRATLGRIPQYLKYLKTVFPATDNISATILAKELGLGEVQVRKDLAAVSGAGRPKTGYRVDDLILSLERFLNDGEDCHVVIVGAGKLGRALLDYGGFGEYGLDITAAFDIAVTKPEFSHSGKPIFPMADFENFCRDHHVKIGILTVPSAQAQEVCDRMVKAGICALWCFASCTLRTPENVLVQYENMALSLAFLNKKFKG